MKNVLNLGIMSRKEFVARTMAIAKGEYVPKSDEPKVWFESTRSMAEVLSNDNRELLAMIAAREPRSLRDPEEISGRKVSNISRTLKTMEKFGIVTLHKENRQVRPVVNATTIKIEIDLGFLLPADKGTKARAKVIGSVGAKSKMLHSPVAIKKAEESHVLVQPKKKSRRKVISE